jgi:hypothetical protein
MFFTALAVALFYIINGIRMMLFLKKLPIAEGNSTSSAAFRITQLVIVGGIGEAIFVTGLILLSLYEAEADGRQYPIQYL